MKEMIQVDPARLIGKGATRSCYHHPDDPDKCVKIDKRETGGPTEKEALYYEKIARLRPHLDYNFIPRFYGMVETDLGKGGVFDLIRDETTGEVSKSFSHYISQGAVAADDPVWIKAHQEYLQAIFDSDIAIRDFNPGNVCARQLSAGGYQLVAIDGIGHRDFLPVCDHFRWALRYKVRRQIVRKDFGTLEEILGRGARKKAERDARR
ncbi:YrbL family protein [Ilumatobacter sp.]|uniref:YrbL family protein n=1 Tax=Ilumatobacter sp. TaxID=1967498 RepID=UPI003C6A7CF2